jgi:hypothetical protein
MRKDNAKRYCLPCTAKTGKLVERVAAAASREREARKAAKVDRAKAKREKAAAREAARFAVAGFDLNAELVRLWKHKAVAEARRTHGARWRSVREEPPSLRIRRCARQPRGLMGLASYGKREIMLATWPGRTLGDLIGTLLHEVVHMVGIHNHGPAFGAELARLALDVYGIDAYAAVRDTRGDWRGVQEILDQGLEKKYPGADDRPDAGAAAVKRVAEQCAPEEPPTGIEIRRYLDAWLRKQGGNASTAEVRTFNGSFTRPDGDEDYDVDHVAWLPTPKPGDTLDVVVYVRGESYDYDVTVPATRGELLRAWEAL